MNDHIHITFTAEKDMVHAADHIEYVLKNPQAADRYPKLTFIICFYPIHLAAAIFRPCSVCHKQSAKQKSFFHRNLADST